MENGNGENSFCKKLIWQEQQSKPKLVLYGLVTKESETHLEFKTAHKKYFLSKSFIIKLEDTNRPFISQEEQEIKEIFNAKPINKEVQP